MDRRKAFGILGGFVAVAFNELKPAKATSGPTVEANCKQMKSRTNTRTSTGSDCRSSGHPCEGNQQCCDGLICSRNHGMNGNAKRCHAAPPPSEECGDITESCCANDSCNGNLVCDEGVCRQSAPPAPCGVVGQICCDEIIVGDGCMPNAVCVNGICHDALNPIACETDNDCPSNTVCVDGVCLSPGPNPPAPAPSPVRACKKSKSPRRCCKQAVRKACRKQGAGRSPAKHGGGGATCRKRGFRRCRQIFVR